MSSPLNFASLSEFMQPTNPFVSLCYYLLRDKVVEMTDRVKPGSETGETEPFVAFDWSRCPAGYVKLAMEMVSHAHASGLASVFCIGLSVLNGLKVFRPTAAECAVLEDVEPAFPQSLYQQPYPTFIIDLPREFSASHSVPGTSIVDGQIHHCRPLAVFNHFDAKRRRLIVCGLMSDGTCLTQHLPLTRVPGDTVAEQMAYSSGKPNINAIGDNIIGLVGEAAYKRFFMPGEEEAALLFGLSNIGISTAMLMTNYGVKTDDPNPTYRDKLLRQIEKLQQDKPKLAQAVFLNRLAPKIISFKQDVKLFRHETIKDKPGEPTGRHVKTHWRRGHLRQQRFGPGLTESKVVFIQAVLVNAVEFGGELADTVATYQ